MYSRPTDRPVGIEAGLKHDDRLTGAAAVDVDATTAYINQPTSRRKVVSGTLPRQELVDGTRSNRENPHRTQADAGQSQSVEPETKP
jgi:hypothetical protein